MGKKRSFINKNKAQKYTVLYQAQSEHQNNQQHERVLVPLNELNQNKSDAEDGPAKGAGHPLAWLFGVPKQNLSLERRKELIELGFPDDGYDYTLHLRTLGQQEEDETGGGSNQVLEEQQEPGQYIPAKSFNQPAEDVRVVDAEKLIVHQSASSEEAAEQYAGGVTAFTRQVKQVRGKTRQQELQELVEFMAEVEGEDEEVLEGEQDDASQPQGVGDLNDDFILQATTLGEEQLHPAHAAGVSGIAVPTILEEEEYVGDDSGSDYDSLEDDGDRKLQASGSYGAPASHQVGPRGWVGSTRGSEYSFALTHRTTMSESQSRVEERFEKLAEEYDSDEIGSLDEQYEQIQGQVPTSALEDLAEDFLEERRVQSLLELEGTSKPDAGSSSRGTAAKGSEVMQQAQQLIQRYGSSSQAEGKSSGQGEEEEAPDSGEDDDDKVDYVLLPKEREKWDCESVLSYRSNTENHPASISDVPKSQGPIVLSQRTGLPKGTQRLLPQQPQLRHIDEGQSDGESSDGVSEFNPQIHQRQKDESPEEKKARKAAVKEAKRKARVAKKELKQQYKDENKKQQRLAAQNSAARITVLKL